MLQLIDNKKNLFFYFFIFLFLSTIKLNSSYLGNLFSLRISDISVAGLSEEKNRIIKEKLNIFQNRNILFLEEDEFKIILGQFNIIDSFEIKKIYPNKINLEIKKTNFIGSTYYKNSKYIIGQNKKLIPFDNLKHNELELPFVFTSGNYERFVHLKKIIDETNFDFHKIESFYYFQIGRWDLKTKSGQIIKLPVKNIKEAINRAHIMIHDKKIDKFNVLDMSMQKYIITSNE